jgi:penicillin G amidase
LGLLKNIAKKLFWLLLLLLLAAAVAAGVYWQRAQPQLSGVAQSAGLQGKVSIERDASDVTHVKADNERDLAYATGWVHAQERSWQLEFNRLVMHGQLSSVLGTATLETDKLMRTLGITRAAKTQFDAAPPEFKAQLQAYADGVNAFHAESSQALPPEFHILGHKPGIWTPEDSVGWTIMMALDLGGNWGTESIRAQAAAVLPTERIWQLYPVYEGEKPRATADFAKLYKDWGVFSKSALSPVAINNIAANPINTLGYAPFFVKNAGEAIQQDLAHLHESDAAALGKGSNNWVLDGSRTVSGKPLVANDPHLGLSAPAIWYFMRLKAPGIDVAGSTLPGMPNVVLGRTEKLAWGFTNVGPDVQDTYLEKLAGADQYVTPSGNLAFKTRTEVIQIKKQPALTITVRESRNGPVLSDNLKAYDWLNKDNFALSLRWTALDATNKSAEAGWRVTRAQTVGELQQAFSVFHAPMQNVVAADTSGATLYQAIGKIVRRKPDNDLMGLVPQPGWLAQYEWLDHVAYADNPKLQAADIAAKGGAHATANQRIHAADYPHFVTQDWAQTYRFDRIEKLLAATPKHSAQTTRDIHADVLSLATVRLLPHFKKAFDAAKPAALASLAEPLRVWDGTMAADSALPLVFYAWADQMVRMSVADKIGADRFKAQYTRRSFRAAVEHMLEKNDEYWCKGACDALAAKALAQAVAELSAKHGTDPSKWLWGVQHSAISRHNPLGNVKPLAKYFDVQVPTGGDTYTVNVGANDFSKTEAPFANRHAASLRAIYDLADLDKSQFIYQTGQSGLVLSSRYRDMSADWAAVKYRNLSFTAPAVQTLSLEPRK